MKCERYKECCFAQFCEKSPLKWRDLKKLNNLEFLKTLLFWAGLIEPDSWPQTFFLREELVLKEIKRIAQEKDHGKCFEAMAEESPPAAAAA